MRLNPNSKLFLCKVPIEDDYRNTILFSSSEAQLNYFNSKVFKKFDNTLFTYIRKDNSVKVEANIDDIINVNYLFYTNTGYSNKIYYCFIKNMSYLSENSTLIEFTTDVIQTYMFDIEYNASFIEREHVSNDTPGLHTLPENLETGEFISNAHIIDDKMDEITSELIYVIATTLDLSNNTLSQFPQAGIRKYNGIASGNVYYPLFNEEDIGRVLNEVANKGQIDAITGLFMIPRVFIESASGPELPESDTSVSYNNSISKQTTLNGYTPRNKKLLIGDYNYLLVSNNNGTNIILKYEDFNTNNCGFKIDLSVTPGCSIRMIPINYKGNSEADEFGINMGKLPICSYPVDMYTNWLTQNSINIGGVTMTSDDLNMANATLSASIGFANSVLTGNVMGAVGSTISGANGIVNAMMTKKQHELTPPQARGNLNCGDVITSSGKNNFHFYKMSIKQEYAKIIDKYFDMFGYQVPNIHSRENWNYIKCLNCNFDGDIPEKDLNTIKSIFNTGITFWHNPNNIYNYNVSNNII